MMTRLMHCTSLMVLTVALASGCGRGDNASTGGPQPSAEGSKYLLATEPAGARDVTAARKEKKDGDDVVLVGRVGGSKKPLGQTAIFTVVDLSLAYCPDEEGCPTP